MDILFALLFVGNMIMDLVLKDYYPTGYLIYGSFNLFFGIIFIRHFLPLVKQKYQDCKRTSETKIKMVLKLFFPVIFSTYSGLMIVSATLSLIWYGLALFR